MEVLAIIFWMVVLIADLVFITQIKRIADEWFPLDGKKKGPRGAGAHTTGCRKMTDAVYHVVEGMSRG